MAAMEPDTLTLEDYDAMISLWRRSPGVILSNADEREAIERYLLRNPDLSFCIRDGEELVGTILAGHDGRRGYLHHLAVDARFRRQGMGGALVKAATEALKREGIDKCHLFLFRKNRIGRRFWRALGWQKRNDIDVLSRKL